MRALLSVSDKRGIVDFARQLVELRWEIVSTGGTAEALRREGIPVVHVEEVTGFPEMMDGRVKTLHPKVHGALLARRNNSSDLEAMQQHGITPIDLVAVNLYPFRETVAKPQTTFAQAIEQIDIGGPSMLRSAAKNHADVIVVVDPDDYPMVLDALKGGLTPGASPGLRQALATKVFAYTTAYDAAILGYLSRSQESLPPRRCASCSSRSSSRRASTPPHSRCSRKRRTCASSSCRWCTTSRPSTTNACAAGSWCRTASGIQPSPTNRSGASPRPAAPPMRNGTTCGSPGRRWARSNPTPSCWSRTRRPSGLAPGR